MRICYRMSYLLLGLLAPGFVQANSQSAALISVSEYSRPVAQTILNFFQLACILLAFVVACSILTVFFLKLMQKHKSVSRYIKYTNLQVVSLVPVFIALVMLVPISGLIGNLYFSQHNSGLLTISDTHMPKNKQIKFKTIKPISKPQITQRIVLPVGTKLRLEVISDNKHSWWKPMLNEQSTAIPGFRHEASFMLEKVGIYTGTCSGLCSNNSQQPLEIIVKSKPGYKHWLVQNKQQSTTDKKHG